MIIMKMVVVVDKMFPVVKFERLKIVVLEKTSLPVMAVLIVECNVLSIYESHAC